MSGRYLRRPIRQAPPRRRLALRAAAGLSVGLAFFFADTYGSVRVSTLTREVKERRATIEQRESELAWLVREQGIRSLRGEVQARLGESAGFVAPDSGQVALIEWRGEREPGFDRPSGGDRNHVGSR